MARGETWDVLSSAIGSGDRRADRRDERGACPLPPPSPRPCTLPPACRTLTADRWSPSGCGTFWMLV